MIIQTRNLMDKIKSSSDTVEHIETLFTMSCEFTQNGAQGGKEMENTNKFLRDMKIA